MKLLVFGSLNIDHTYQVHHLVREGETISSSGYAKNIGGKGFNQAAALAKACLPVHFAGAIGPDGTFLTDYMRSLNIDTSNIQTLDVPTGHAIIQVSAPCGFPRSASLIASTGRARLRCHQARLEFVAQPNAASE